MTFIESPWFEVWRPRHLDEEALRALQNLLLGDSRAGQVIPDSGGLRKLRLALPGRGKRGGARLIYYYWAERDRLYLLYAYAKNAQGDLTKDQLKRLSSAMQEDLSDG